MVVKPGIQIGEAAKRTALSVDAIRFYEKRSLLPEPLRTPGRFRLYTASDLSSLMFIRQMQGLGFSLSEIKQLLDLRSRRADACASVRAIVRAKLDTVRNKIRELRKLEHELATDLRLCDSELDRRGNRGPRACPVLKETRS